MDKRLLINASAIETRIALVEGKALAELHVDDSTGRSIVGNIYKGRVLRVLPGMQAAFVDIGLDKAAFMHVSDFSNPPLEDGGEEVTDASEGNDRGPSLITYVDEETAEAGAAVYPDPDEGGTSDADDLAGVSQAADEEIAVLATESAASSELGAPTEAAGAVAPDGTTSLGDADGGPLEGVGPDAEESTAREPSAKASRQTVKIEDVLRKGQEIIVQVSKESIGSKGARITSHVSLPGRYVVYMPTTDHVGVSRRIEDEEERRRLREIVLAGRANGSGGFIVRTACEGVSKREITADMRFLSRLWSRISRRGSSQPAPALLHEDLDLILRSVRDLFTSDVAQVVVDRPDDHRRVVEFIDGVLQPKLKSRVQLYEGIQPIFDAFGVETQVNRALDRRVWLKSGGYLVFDQTEALTTVDVNTGRFVGKKTHEETVLRTNLEAARMVVDQLRLRNIGGIIIIDFIDMEESDNRRKVTEALEEAVKRDKARTNILGISELGLVQMTRKRTRDNLRQLITSPCHTCGGDGRVRSIESLAADVLRMIRRRAAGVPEAGTLEARVSGEVAAALHGPLHRGWEELEARLGVEIAVTAEPGFARDQCQVDVGATAEVAASEQVAAEQADRVAGET